MTSIQRVLATALLLGLLACPAGQNVPKVGMEPSAAAPIKAQKPSRVHCSLSSQDGSGAQQRTETPCMRRLDGMGKGGFSLTGLREAELLDGIGVLTVTVTPTGEAEVRGLTKAGINSRWGMARRSTVNGDCWTGSDFEICTRPQPRCGSHELLSSKAAMAKTPRKNVDAERLAVRLSEELVASEHDYKRIQADLKAIRAFVQGDPGARGTWPRLAVQSVTLKIKPQATAALRAGSYKGFDCLNDWYGGRLMPMASSIDLLFITFKGWYHGKHIASAYGNHPDVEWSEPSAMGGAGDDISLCNERVGGSHRYLFSHGSGDCPGGCIDWVHRGYDVTPDGQVTALKPVWKIRGLGKPSERPAWAHASCFRRP